MTSSPTASAARAPLVGRERELATLVAGLEAALSGHGHLYLVSGEPGVGKTRLLEEMEARAGPQQAIVAWGRCWEGADAPPFWPWVQVLRPLLAAPSAAETLREDPEMAARLARLVPRARQSLTTPSGSPAHGRETEALATGDRGIERFEILDAVVTFLCAAARRLPLVLLVDDLHAARLPSLLLLELLARDLHDVPLLVVVTHRDTETRAANPFADRLAELSRESTAVPLRGLDLTATGELVRAIAGRRPSIQLVESIHAATAGNPFYLDEVVRLLLAEGRFDRQEPNRGGLGIPDRVRSAVRARLEPLPQQTRAALEVAATIGLEPDAELVAAVLGRPTSEVRESLEAALRAGFTRPGAATGSLRFAHALIRDTLYDDLPLARRIHLHHTIGAALERRHVGWLDAVVTSLAHHFLHAQPEADATRTIDYAQRAGEQALGLCAYEQAIGYFEQAVALADRSASMRVEQRTQIHLALARAAAGSGDMERAKRACVAAASDARRLGSAALLAEAALTLRVGVDAATADPDRIALLEEALAAAAAEDSPLRARLLAQLACELYYTGDELRRDALSREALAMARRLGDRRAIAHALSGRCLVLWGLPDQEERVPLAAELLELARAIGDRELALHAHRWRILDAIAYCDVTVVDREITAAAHLVETLRAPYYRWWLMIWRASRATIAGRFDEGMQLAVEAYSIGSPAQPHDATSILSSQSWMILWLRGDFAEMLPMVEEFCAQNAAIYPESRIGLTAAYAGAGRLEDARRELETLAAGNFAVLPQRSGSWLLCLANLAHTCGILGDTARAAIVYELMRTSASRGVASATGMTCAGPVDLYLGILATVLRDFSAADAHFATSLAMSHRLGAPAFVAMTQTSRAAMLIARGATQDHELAERLLGQALATAESLGMKSVAADATRLLEQLRAYQREVSEPASDVLVSTLVREGEYWTLRHRGSVCRVRDRAGMSYLATLLERPHEDVAAMALVAGPAADEHTPTASRGELHSGWPAGAGEVLDSRARAEIRGELAELATALAEAERGGDLGRAARLRAERAALDESLRAALGLGGRARRMSSPVDRARVRVTRALRSAIDRIRAVDAQLGDHLAGSIRTGTFCCYAPAVAAAWTVVRD